jgi:hypothetical protein
MTAPATTTPDGQGEPETQRPPFDCLCGEGQAVFVGESDPDGAIWRGTWRCETCETEYQVTAGGGDDD